MTDRGHGTVIHRMERYESFGVPEIDLWLAGSSHIFRRVSGVLDSGCFQTLLRPKTAALLSLPRLGKALPRRTVSGAIDVVPSRVMVRFQPAAAPAVVIPLPVGIMVYDAAPSAPLDVNLFGADLFNLFVISVSRRSISISLTEES